MFNNIKEKTTSGHVVSLSQWHMHVYVWCWYLDSRGSLNILPASSLSCLAFLEGQRSQMSTEWNCANPEGYLEAQSYRPKSGWSSVRLSPVLVGGAGTKRNFNKTARLHQVAGGKREAFKLGWRDQVEAWRKTTAHGGCHFWSSKEAVVLLEKAYLLFM